MMEIVSVIVDVVLLLWAAAILLVLFDILSDPDRYVGNPRRWRIDLGLSAALDGFAVNVTLAVLL